MGVNNNQGQEEKCHEAQERRRHTWNASTKSYEGNSSDRILETNSAAKVRGQVSNKGSKKSNSEDRDDECCITLHVFCREELGG